MEYVAAFIPNDFLMTFVAILALNVHQKYTYEFKNEPKQTSVFFTTEDLNLDKMLG